MRTMKIMKRMMSLAAAILALSACSESDDILSSFHNDPNAVHITAEVGKASADGFTRSNPLGATEKDQQKFNKDDEISVKADGQEAVTYKFNGSEWIPQDSKFLKWESESMNFTAYYPASYNGGEITQPLEFPTEKSLAAADFMSYTGSQSNTNGNTLTLTMQRKMARVVVEVVGFNDQYDKNTSVNSVTIKGVKAYNHKTDGKFYALMVPCDADNKAKFLSLEVGEGNTETLTGIPALEAGKSYTYHLTVGKNKVVVTGITIADWTTGETLDGKAEEITPYVTFTAEKTQTFMMTVNGPTIPNLEYSVNEGEWKTVVANTKVDFGGENSTLRLRGTNNLTGTAANDSHYSTITFTKNDVPVECTGDIRTLLDWKNYKKVDTKDALFCWLFGACVALTSAPELPATTLSANCYYGMFSGCTNLKTAPALPATKLADYCYYDMFYGCTNLKTAPALPAETLAEGCYSSMFESCTNLSSVTMLAPSDQIAGDRFTDWLKNAGTEEGITRTLKVTDAAAYYKLESEGVLPDNWKKGNCNLDTGPCLTFTAAKAQTFTMTATEDYTISGLEYSVNGGEWTSVEANKEVSFGGTNGNLRLRGTNPKGTATGESNYSTITFTGNEPVACTGDIRTLLDYKNYKTVETNQARFYKLFYNCKVLTSAPDLPATSLADYCYAYMFYECSKLQEAPKLPATKLVEHCYGSMFESCTNLKTALELPAETLADGCYNWMLYDCSNLTSVTMLAPSDQISSNKDCCYGWLTDAGTGAKSRTLIVKDEDAYKALVNKGCLPADYWQKGKCTVN